MAEDYQLLLRMPFYYVLHMSDRSRKLVPFQVFLDGLNSGVKQICHRFIYKLKRKRAQSRYKTYQKRYIDVYFQNHHILQTILFISSIKHP